MITPSNALAANLLDDVLAFDQPIGRLTKIVVAMSEGPERTAIKECCGELLRHQFDLIERITTAHPELDKIVEARLPAFDAEFWKQVKR